MKDGTKSKIICPFLFVSLNLLEIAFQPLISQERIIFREGTMWDKERNIATIDSERLKRKFIFHVVFWMIHAERKYIGIFSSQGKSMNFHHGCWMARLTRKWFGTRCFQHVIHSRNENSFEWMYRRFAWNFIQWRTMIIIYFSNCFISNNWISDHISY